MSAEFVCLHLLGFGTVDGSLMAVQNLGPTRNQLDSRFCNGGSASSAPTDRRGRQTWRLLTITRSIAMALTAIHPGERLAEELEALDMSAAELARKINVPTNRITQILNGTRAITGDTALRLAHFFGTSAQFWLNLQSLYELRLAQEKVGKSIKELPRLKRRELVHA
jgi:addiction module HigA family antidote